MNFAKVIIGRGYAIVGVYRTSAQQQKWTQTFLGTQWRRNYATTKSTLKTQKRLETPTNLESKLQQLEIGAISTPSRYAHAAAATAVTKIDPKTTLRTRKKRNDTAEAELSMLGFFNVTAYTTAEEYNLEAIKHALHTQQLYTTKKFFSTDNLGVEQDVLYVTAKYKVGRESRDIFFFREGSVVFWNFNDTETNNILSFLRPYEKDAYLMPIVRNESESMPYTYVPEAAVDVEGDLVEAQSPPNAFFQNGKFYLTSGGENFLQKYTFSNAMSISIKLGMWEATLDRYIDSMEYLTEDLKKGRRIRISRAEMLRKTGELFALRHSMNLSSDLLDTPDFYWDREKLEALYLQVCSYFSISRRTRVMNEKLNHCVELAELISHNLNDKHHIRLEWMIIILIMVEVGFEIVHYMDRYYVEENH